MIFGNPEFGPVIFAMIAVSLFLVWSFQRRRAAVERFVEKQLAPSVAANVRARMRVLKAVVLTVGILFALIAYLRPQWGFQWEEVKKKGLDILVAVDTSKSMLARDVKPNRLMRSKLAIKDMVKRLKGDRIGLIAFSGTAFLQCPLTQDYSGFLLALDDLDTATIPRGGTNLSAAIQETMDVLKGPEKKYKVLIIITDGEDHEGDAVKVSESARDLGIRIFCVGVGTEEGELIQMVGESGKRGYLKDSSGNVVKSRLNEEILKRIALNTGGAYVKATGAEFGLNLIYDKTIATLEKRDIESKMMKRYQDRFQIFLAVAFVLLCIEPLIPAKKSVA